MGLSILCVASPIRDGSALYNSMTTHEARMREAGILYELPKIGRHITYIPPFYGTEDLSMGLAIGLELCKAFYASDIAPQIMQDGRLDFFRGETDSLVIRLKIEDVLRDLVERFRSRIPKNTRFVHPIASYFVNFHATIGEGIGLAQNIDTHGGLEKVFSEITTVYPAHLEPPVLFEKKEHSWIPVRV